MQSHAFHRVLGEPVAVGPAKAEKARKGLKGRRQARRHLMHGGGPLLGCCFKELNLSCHILDI